MDQRAGLVIFIIVVMIIQAVSIPGFIKYCRERKQKEDEEEEIRKLTLEIEKLKKEEKDK